MPPEVPTQEFSGKALAFYANDQVQNAALIARLADVATVIFLLPSDLEKEHVEEIVNEHGVDILITGADFAGSNVPVMPPQAITGLDPDNFSLDCRSIAFSKDDELADFVLATSGTTGKPKLVRHSFDFLSTTTRVGKADDTLRRWGLVYDVCRFAGFQVAIQALLTKSVLIAPPLAMALEKKIAALVAAGVTHMSATPSFWRRWLMSPQAKDAPLQRITLGGEIVDQPILDKLQLTYPDAKIVHIYASTEAGVGFTVGDCKEGFPKSLLNDKSGGFDLKVVDGRLFIRRPNGANSYLGSDSGFIDSDDYVDTGDQVEERGDRYIFLGRDNGSVNIGGVKVFPEVTERQLLKHAAVSDCVVYPAKSSMMGNTLNCSIVLAPDVEEQNTLKFELMRWCKDSLAPEFVPTKIRFTDSLGLSSSGKIDRKKA